MNPLILASAMALFRATLSSSDPLFPTDGTSGGPTPVNGVWAALPAGCEAPTSLDLSTWAKCATPIGFLDGEMAALQKPGPGKPATNGQFYSIARTHYWVAKGTPAIVQVDVPILLSHSTVYIAIQPDETDDKGTFVAATGWPILCPPSPVAGVTNDDGRCTADTAAGVQAAAMTTPDPSKTYRLVRINAQTESDAAPPPAPPSSTGATPDMSAPEPAAPEPAAPEPAQPSAETPPSTPPTAAPGEVMETPLAPPGGDAGSGPGATPPATPPPPGQAAAGPSM